MERNIKKVLIAVICLAMTVGGASPGFAKDAQVSLNGLTDYVTAADSGQDFLSWTVSSEKQKSLALMKNQRFDKIVSDEAYSEESADFDTVKSLRSGGIDSSGFDLMEDQVNSAGNIVGGGSGGIGGIGGSGSSASGGASGGGSAPSTDTEVMDYHATEGDWATPLYFLRIISKIPENRWSKATLIPISGGKEINLDLFCTSGFGGVLFLKDTPAGRYRILIDNDELDRKLKIIGKAEKYAISAGNMLPTAFYGDQPNDFMQDIFNNPDVHNNLKPIYERFSYNYSDDYYTLYADGKLYFSVYGVNLTIADISSATVQYGSENTSYATLEKTIAGRSAGNNVRELILVMNPVSKTMSPPAEIKLSVQFKSGVSSSSGNQITKNLEFDEYYLAYYVDTTHINDLSIDLLLPEPIYSEPELSILIGYLTPYACTSNEHSNGRYTFSIPQDSVETDMFYLQLRLPDQYRLLGPTIEDIIGNSLNDEISVNMVRVSKPKFKP